MNVLLGVILGSRLALHLGAGPQGGSRLAGGFSER